MGTGVNTATAVYFRGYRLIRILLLGLLLSLLLQGRVSATGSSVSLYLERGGQRLLLTQQESNDFLYDMEQLQQLRRVLSCVEVDPQIVTLHDRGAAVSTLTMEPSFPDATRSAALMRRAAEIAAAAAQREGFRRQIHCIADSIRDMAHYDTIGVQNGELDENRCAYGALIDGEATCEGYANAFLLVCRTAGIPCVRVLGYRDGQYHTWNAVYDGSKWFMCDLTVSAFLLPEDSFPLWANLTRVDQAAYAAAKIYCLENTLSGAL